MAVRGGGNGDGGALVASGKGDGQGGHNHSTDHHGFIYKPGEGYWVRVLTVVAINIICLAAAAWSFTQLGALTLPADHWQAVVRADAALTPGQPAQLVTTKISGDGSETIIGTATTGAISTGLAGESVLRLDALSLSPGRSATEAQVIRAGDSAAPVGAIGSVPIFPLFYLQAGIAGALVLLGVAISYNYVGRKPGSVEFLIATDSEMRKVNWSTRREILGSTYVVIGACVLIAGTLFLLDFAFASFFQAIDILKSK